MSGETTTVYLCAPEGTRLMALGASVGGGDATYDGLTYTDTVNGVGQAALTVQEGAIPAYWLKPDYQLEITRSIDPAAPEQLEGERRWFIERIVRRVSQRQRVLIAAASTRLLDGRDVAYGETSAQAVKTAAADDMIKAIARENLGGLATDAARQLRSDLFQVAADVTLGPSLTKGFADKNVLQVCQEIAAAAQQQGAAVFFDVVWTGAIFELRTYLGQRGRNRAAGGSNPLLIEADALGEVEVDEDYSQERTVVRAGDQSAQNDTQIARSPWARREATISARGGDSASQLAEARRGLWERRYRTTFTATMTATAGLRYGVDWGWGDRLTVLLDGATAWPVRVDGRTVAIQGGRETVTAQLRVEV